MSPVINDQRDSADMMRAVLDVQRQACLEERPVPAEARIDRIDRAIGLLVDHQDELCQAMEQDFGARPAMLSGFADIMSAVNHLKHSRSHVKRWMKPEKRALRFPLGLLGARARIEYQPLGVVGIISPWNFPVLLTFGPIAGAFAAGNRVMVKPSEFTPETSALMERLIEKHFDASELAIFPGGPDVGKAFSALPFDHLLFTGATAIAPHILHAAADNLTPVTLELGGKSPTIIGRDADLSDAAGKIVMGKCLNAGQACLAPDYVYVPEAQLEALADEIAAQYQRMYPDGAHGSDVTAIINQRHAERLQDYLDQAEKSGTRIRRLGDDLPGDRKHALTLVMEPADDLGLMREEIFGPQLPLRGYRDIDEVIDFINRNDRPLGLYYFGSDKAEQRRVLDRTVAGGVTLNDVMFHISVDDLPFGGVGPSGMGAYHGIEGFKTFSHAKSIYQQSPINVAALLGGIPPYGKRLRATLKREIRK